MQNVGFSGCGSNEQLCEKLNILGFESSKDSDQPGYQSLMCPQWVAEDHTNSEDSDQTEWMPSLIQVFARCKPKSLNLSTSGSDIY